MAADTVDVIVIGAGISGLAFARFFLDIHPQTNLLILEEDTSIGGVWNKSRIYDYFWTQSGRRMVGFSDVPFDIPPNAPYYHGTFQAKHFNTYLEDYADSHVYANRTLRDRILLGHKVESVTRSANGTWNITATSHPQTNPEPVHFTTTNLAHFAAFTRTQLPHCTHIAILGSSKSAADFAYECVKKGKVVNWIVPPSSSGPAQFFPAQSENKWYEGSTESGTTRWSALFSPSAFLPREGWGLTSWLVWLVHRTALCRSYVKEKVESTDATCRSLPQYRDRPNALPGFEHLEPDGSAFWVTNPLGMAQHDDFWDVLSQNVHVHRAEITSLQVDSILLDNGTELPTDAILCGTGWHTHYPFIAPELAPELGLPVSPELDTPKQAAKWDALLSEADKRVLSDFPFLSTPPPHTKPATSTTNIRLYNCIAPLNGSPVVFLARAHLSNSFRTAEAQAIWATAFLDGSVKLPSPGEAERRVAYMNALSRRRYPTVGQAGDYLFFELVAYTDWLLEEVGLKSHRKGWWSDWVEPWLASDFKNTVSEYRNVHGY